MLSAMTTSPVPSSSPIPSRRSDAKAAALVAAWQASGQGASEWCQAQGLSRSALGSWRKRTAKAKGFIPVLPATAPLPLPRPGGLVVELSEGIRITGLTPAEVAAVVAALRHGGGR